MTARNLTVGTATTPEEAVTDTLVAMADGFIAVRSLDHFLLAPDAPSAEDIWEVIRIAGERILHWRRINHLLEDLVEEPPDLVLVPGEQRLFPVYRESLATWLDMLVFEATVGPMERLWLEETFPSANDQWKKLGRSIWEDKGNHVNYAHSRLYPACTDKVNRRAAQATLSRILPAVRETVMALPDGPAYRDAGMRSRDGATLWDTFANEMGPLLESMDLDPPSWHLAGRGE